MEGLRKDAARNRARIVDAARESVARGEPLTLNAVARAADVGVGTVYRHFGCVEELEEVLVWDRFDELAEIMQAPGSARLEAVVAAHFALLAEDELFERVTSRAAPALDRTAAMRTSLVDTLALLVAEARSAGRVRAGVDADAVLVLVCGLAHGVRSAGLAPGSASAQTLLQVVLDGLRGGEPEAAPRGPAPRPAT
ncbi:TetR/AcrR family transcriptional regulator [Cellulomonas cellasea]|uniref:AcrR family transcriptional regulator n=1 Tax=Cellulomonas cellasea TaxID=43670 RepID=A0A7W4YB85_9CELL|nr:TetR/AcrR family transcriptional regulator [Cellulomonas cellasea]MBB2923635.1 AcrR family transcriptional regulator [Cellulomonas cellasea]